jgi:hypothetical protein
MEKKLNAIGYIEFNIVDYKKLIQVVSYSVEYLYNCALFPQDIPEFAKDDKEDEEDEYEDDDNKNQKSSSWCNIL